MLRQLLNRFIFTGHLWQPVSTWRRIGSYVPQTTDPIAQAGTARQFISGKKDLTAGNDSCRHIYREEDPVSRSDIACQNISGTEDPLTRTSAGRGPD